MELPKGYIDDQERRIGLFLDLPESEYHAVKAFSYSGAKEFSRSPAHFQAYLEKEWEIDPDREKFKAVHLLCLEPAMQKRLVVKDGTWRDKVKEEVQQLQKAGNIVLKSKDLETAKAIAANVLKHSLAGPAISQSLCEASIFWIEDGVYCKARIDILSVLGDGRIALGDLKNFGDISRDGILGYQVGERKYFMQMAMYYRAIEVTFGRPPVKMYWIFCEDSPPHGVKFRNCPDAIREAGWLALGNLFPLYKECEESGVWPCYEEDEEDIGMPERYFGVIGGNNE